MAKILVADDSGTMRKIIIRSLIAVGVEEHCIVEASDGQQAADLFVPGDFYLLITDRNMPRKNGIDLIKEVRIQDPDVIIIMVTTESEKRAVLEAINAGVNDYLAKPFEADVLRQKLVKHGCDGSLV